MLACIKKKLVLGLPAFFAPHLLANNTINGSYTQPFALCSLSQGTYPFVVCCGVLQSHKSCHLSLFSLFPFNFWNNSSCKIWYFVTKIVLTYCEKKLFQWSRKTFKIRGWRPRIYKNFEITRTICSNSEMSEQILVTECFFNLFLEISHI